MNLESALSDDSPQNSHANRFCLPFLPWTFHIPAPKPLCEQSHLTEFLPKQSLRQGFECWLLIGEIILESWSEEEPGLEGKSERAVLLPSFHYGHWGPI